MVLDVSGGAKDTLIETQALWQQYIPHNEMLYDVSCLKTVDDHAGYSCLSKQQDSFHQTKST